MILYNINTEVDLARAWMAVMIDPGNGIPMAFVTGRVYGACAVFVEKNKKINSRT